MPFATNSEAVKRVPALKNKTKKQVEVFREVFNKLIAEGESEDSAIPKAIAAANKVKKSMDITKNTMQDRRSILNDAVRKKFRDTYVNDFDDTYVYVERYEGDEGYQAYKLTYSLSDMVNVELGDELIKVVRLTEYKEVTKSLDEDTPTWFKSFLKNFTATEKEGQHPLVKQFDEEEMIAIEPLYIAVGEVDGQGYGIDTIEEMEYLVKSFNEANESGVLQTSLFHNHKTSSFSVIKAWVNPVECFIGDSLVKEGQPIVKIQFNNKKAWELRKNGTLMGLSIGARAAEVGAVDE